MASILSAVVYSNLKNPPELSPSGLSVISATDDPIKVWGQTSLAFNIGGVHLKHTFLVAEIGGHGLIGMDFLRKYKCILDVPAGSLKWPNGEIPLQTIEPSGISCCKVLLAENVVIPPKSEIIAPGKLAKEFTQAKYGILEPNSQFSRKTNSFLAAELVTPCNGQVPLRLMNPGNEPLTLEQGDLAGIYSETDTISLPVSKDNLDKEQSESNEEFFSTHPAARVRTISPSPETPEHLKDLVERTKKNLTELELKQVRQVLSQHSSSFREEGGPRGFTNLVSHEIDTGNSPPIRQPLRRVPATQRPLVEQEVQKMLNEGIIEPSCSPWASPIVLVKKKDGSYRWCCDYRRLNLVSKKDAHPLNRIDDTLDSLSGSVYFCTLDLDSAYWQVPMHEKDKEKTAFLVHNGLYQFKTMPFGLCNAPSTFSRLMQRVLGNLQFSQCLVYLDDIIVYGRNFDQCLNRLTNVLNQIQQSGLKLKPAKCNLFERKVNFLGHIVSESGIECDPEKISKISSWPTPRCVRQVRSILGLASYYRKFVPEFSEICKPLYGLTEKGVKFVWSPECEEAFQALKSRLVSAPILAYPRDDDPYILDTDASDVGIGAVLSQVQDGEEKVIAYASSVLNKHERRYCVTRKELLSLVKFTKHFKPYLYGRKFLIRTDHGSLKWLCNFKEPEGQIARWLESLSEYDYVIEHRPGRLHQNADSLSRVFCNLCPQCKQDTCPSVKVSEESVEPDPPETQNSTELSESANPVRIGKIPTGNPKGPQSSKLWSTPAKILTLIWTLIAYYLVPGSSCSSLLDVPNSGVMRILRTPLVDLPPCSNWLENVTTEKLRQEQMNDPELSPLIQLLENRTTSRPPWQDISHLSEHAKALWMMWNILTFQNGILYINRPLYTGNSDSPSKLILVVPRSLREGLLRTVHNGPTGGHLGSAKLLSRLQHSFYWVNMKQDVELWCRKCLSCAKRKSPPKKTRAPLCQQLSGCPLERVAIDFAGPLPETTSYNRYIMVVTDYFTKYSEAYPIPDITASTAATVLVSEFICRFGVPRQIHTDQGSQFESTLFQEVCQLLGIDKTRTTPFRPCSNGQVERLNRSIKDMLFHYLSERQDDWDLHLPLVMMAYRSTTHSSTKFSPNFLMFGREIECPETVLFDVPKSPPSEPCEYVSDLRDRMLGAYNLVRQNLSRAAAHQKRNYDHRSSRPPSYKIGDVVLLKVESAKKGKSRKLGPHWVGPYLITKVISPVNVQIRKGPKFPTKIVHVDRLKSFAGEFDSSWYLINNTPERPTPPSTPDPLHSSSTLLPRPISSRPKRSVRTPKRFGDWV